jgi:hypothetical protein
MKRVKGNVARIKAEVPVRVQPQKTSPVTATRVLPNAAISNQNESKVVRVTPQEHKIQRISSDNTNVNKQNAISRIRPGKTQKQDVVLGNRVYSGGMVKDQSTGMFWKDGQYYKKFDGCYFKCWPDGNIRDQKTSTHVCWFGKISRVPTEAEYKEVALIVQRAMMRIMPSEFFDEEGRRISCVDAAGNFIYERILK